MQKLILSLLVLIFWQTSLYALSPSDQTTLKSVLKIVRSAHLPAPPQNKHLSPQELLNTIQKISEDPDALRKILAVRDGFYTSDGEILRRILLTAAKSTAERDGLIAVLQFEKCKKWFWECKLPPVTWDQLRFKLQSSLKSNLDALETKLIELGALTDDDLSSFDPRSLDDYEEYFKLFVELDPWISDLVPFLFNYYTKKSLRNLNQQELHELLGKLILHLSDNIHKAQPRS